MPGRTGLEFEACHRETKKKRNRDVLQFERLRCWGSNSRLAIRRPRKPKPDSFTLWKEERALGFTSVGEND